MSDLDPVPWNQRFADLVKENDALKGEVEKLRIAALAVLLTSTDAKLDWPPLIGALNGLSGALGMDAPEQGE